MAANIAELNFADLSSPDLVPHDKYEMGLRHAQQAVRNLPGSNRWTTKVLNFSSSADFDSVNDIQIPSMPLVVHDAFVEFNVAALSTGTPLWEMTTTWLAGRGAELLYNQQSAYQMAEAEATASVIQDSRLPDFLSKQECYAVSTAANEGAASLLYLPLTLICDKVFSKVGPVSAYPSTYWAFRVPLRAKNQCYQSGGSTTGGALNSMRLFLVGNVATIEEVLRTKQALDSMGLFIHFLRAEVYSDTYADNSGSLRTDTFTFPAVNGAVGAIRILIRDKTAFDTAESSNLAWDMPEGPGDVINAGTTSNPTDVWGQVVPIRFAKRLFHYESLEMGPSYPYIDSTNELDMNAGSEVGILNINFYHHGSDQNYGTSSGSYPVANDLRIDIGFTTDTEADNKVDFVIYTHRLMQIATGSMVINPSA